jgi:hypothetical protein
LGKRQLGWAFQKDIQSEIIESAARRFFCDHCFIEDEVIFII